jgi:hypothetical protein
MVWLNIYGRDVWRRIAVPANISFKRLHFILQDSFGWQNRHMHTFSILDKIPLHTLAYVGIYEDHDPAKSNGIPTYLETARLGRFLPRHNKLIYTYDYGDNWEHYIELANIDSRWEGPCPVCLEGGGASPPEDAGGEPGYLEFLKTVENKKDPRRKELLSWGRTQGYEPFDRDEINRRLERVMRRRD